MWWVAGAALAISGCQSYPWVDRPPQRVSRTRIDEVVLASSNTDVLFVIDNSGSMGEEQANLIDNTTVFIEELAQSENAYRVGVVTTDVSRSADSGNLRINFASGGNLSSAGCNIGPTSTSLDYLERPDLSATDLVDQRCRLVEDFIATVSDLGVGGSGREAGLLAARRATDPALDLNSGFIRPEADLALIFLTDEDDCSFGDYGILDPTNPSCYENETRAIDPRSFVDHFALLKGSVTKVRAALIAGGVRAGESGADFTPRGCHIDAGAASARCGCWSSSDQDYFCEYLQRFGHPCQDTNGCVGRVSCAASSGGPCNTDRCDALPGGRYYEFIGELRRRRLRAGFSGGTFADSICQADYDQTLLTIARTVVLSQCFSLDVQPTSLEAIRLILRRPNASGGADEFVLPRYDASDSTAGCRDCGDCPGGAWTMPNSNSICLDCGLKKEAGDAFSLTVLNEITGRFEGD